MKRKAIFPIGNKKAKSIPVEIYLGDDPNQCWKGFIQGCEEAVSYMLLQYRALANGEGLDGFEKVYKKVLTRKSVTVTVNAEDWDNAQITFVVNKGKNFRYLTDCLEAKIDGDLGVRKGGGLTTKGKPVDSEEVEEPCLDLFKKLILDLGCVPTEFGFDDNDMPEGMEANASQEPVPKAQQETEQESEEENQEQPATLDDIASMIIIPDKVPEDIPAAERDKFVPLLPYLSSLGSSKRNEYIGNLHRFVDKINDYIQRVTNAANDLDGLTAKGADEVLVATLANLGFSEDQIKATLMTAAQLNGEQVQEQEDEDIPVDLPKDKPESAYLASMFVKKLSEHDDVDINELPGDLTMKAALGEKLTITEINNMLKNANVCYHGGSRDGKIVQFPKAK